MEIAKVLKEEGQNLLEILIDSLDSWIFIVSKDNKFLWANKKFLKMINKNIKGLANKKIDAVSFLKTSQIDKKFKICMAGNKQLTEEIDLNIKKKKYSIKFNLFPFFYKKSNDFVILAIMEDITNLSTLSKKIKETNWFVENIFNSVRVYSIITTDNKFFIQRFNKGAELLFAYSYKEAEKKLNIKDMIPKQSTKSFQEIIDALKILNLVRREINMKNKSNEPIMVDLTVSKIIDENNRHAGYIFIAFDITEHKKLKDSIEKQNMELVRLYQDTLKANKAKSIFLANMSHELRTPLTAILGFSELMIDEKIGSLNDSQKEFLNDIYSSGKHLLELINDVLDLSKIEAERLVLNIEKVCLNDIILSAKTFILPFAKKKNIRLINKIPIKQIWAQADESRLKQALYNLYSNASKFTPKNGRITTEVRVNYPRVQISIIDTGIGIKPEDQEVIFEEFSQIENPYIKKYSGTGLGLTLVKKFTEMMNGKITVFSKGKGKGSKFTLTLPLSEE